MHRYFWDFFGGDAEATARHFERHLEQFLAAQGLQGLATGLVSEDPLHHAVWCDVPESAEAVITTRLRPRRREP